MSHLIPEQEFFAPRRAESASIIHLVYYPFTLYFQKTSGSNCCFTHITGRWNYGTFWKTVVLGVFKVGWFPVIDRSQLKTPNGEPTGIGAGRWYSTVGMKCLPWFDESRNPCIRSSTAIPCSPLARNGRLLRIASAISASPTARP